MTHVRCGMYLLYWYLPMNLQKYPSYLYGKKMEILKMLTANVMISADCKCLNYAMQLWGEFNQYSYMYPVLPLFIVWVGVT